MQAGYWILDGGLILNLSATDAGTNRAAFILNIYHINDLCHCKNVKGDFWWFAIV